MPLPLYDFVMQTLLENDRAKKIHLAIQQAWASTIDKYPERGRWRRKATFRNILWEIAIRELQTLEDRDPDFKCVLHKDTASFILENEVLIRFKHADISLVTANYPTCEASAFDNHDVDLYGYSGLQRVELCYVLNEFETALIWVGVVARNKGSHLWKIELVNEGILPQTVEPMFDEITDTAKLARIKTSQPEKNAKKKKDNG